MKKILTAKKWLNRYALECVENNNANINEVENIMIHFARLHVEEALKIALAETPYGSSTDMVSYEDCVHILDCYPPENIR